MRISELSSPDVRQLYQDPISILLSQVESLTNEIERLSPESSVPEHISSDLRRCLSQLSQLSPFNNSVKLQIWKFSYRLWNACVDISNSITMKSSASGGRLGAVVQHAEIRQVAADLLSIVIDVSGVPSPALKAASFYCKTGSAWHELGKFDLASDCFEKATNLTSKIEIATISDREEQKLLFDLNIARSRTAWEALDRTLAITLLNRSKKFLFESAENYKALANQYLFFGKALLSKDDNIEKNMPLKLMNDALELSEKGLRVVKRSDESLSLKHLRDKTLRFIAAVHLQQEEFESVIKCVRVLRDNNGGSHSDPHPSLSVLAMKAWLGLGRHVEAEKELRGMVVNKGVPEGVWVSAIEAYFKTVGMAGGDTVKSVFMGLLGRCQVSPSAAIRVIYKVVGVCDSGGGDGTGGEVLQLRAKLAAELASDDRVVVLFSGDRAEKERTAIHAILWNCASSHFRLKDYRISAELYEKSLLYLPRGIEGRTLRAKGFRVLCLCHLGHGQLDQAYEYIDEAQKLEPNIACSFLKFKVYLQRKDHDGAITQMHALSSCADFTVDFLTLAVHEAVSSRALKVAVASLSSLLKFYSSGNSMPVTEIVVLRTLVTILLQDPGNEQEILEFMKKAEARAIELGPDNYFGKGEVGKRERNWIALNSWNLGTSAGTKKNYQLCAEFMRLAFEFYSLKIDEGVNENNVMVCNAIILTVSAMIAAEKQKNVPLQEAEVKQAIELLDRAGKILSSGNKLSDCQDHTIDPSLQFIYTLNSYELYGRLKDSASQHLIVKNFSTSKACNPTYLLHIGVTASQGPFSNPEVATFALSSCLPSLLASLEPDYQNVALAIRRLITVSGVYNGEKDDETIYGLYKQAYRIMVGLKESEFPVDEGKWLATTAWNRASCSMRLGHDKSAKKWMAIGLDLAMNVPGMDSYKASMEEFVSEFEKKSRVQETSPG
ncbi:hypothetical protein V2J09_005055 [Rumex salicifolius]